MAFPRPYGRYILEDRLAMGGMAEIFRARTATAGFEKRVCIKRVLPHFLEEEDFVTMFRDEAKTAARLQHANVVQVFDFGEVEEPSGTTLFLAMELVEGSDLRRLADQSRKKKLPFSIGEVTQIGIDVCRGLHHAHTLKDEAGVSLGIVHRDVSPHNILVSRQGEVKVTDFGIAKAAERATHTSTGIVKGKVAYMSPEQAEGKPFDHRLDQWAVGVVLWELLCGERLFRGENDATILRKVLSVDVPAPHELRADVPAELEAIIMRALAGEPDDRFKDLREMELALSRFLFSGTIDSATAEVSGAYARIMDGTQPVPRKTAVLDVPRLGSEASQPAPAPESVPAPPPPTPTTPTTPPHMALVTDELPAATGVSQVFGSSGRNTPSPDLARLVAEDAPTLMEEGPGELRAAVAAFEARSASAANAASRSGAHPPAIDGREPSRSSRPSTPAPDTALAEGALVEAARALDTDEDGTPATRTLVPAEHRSAPHAAVVVAAPPPATSSRAPLFAAAVIVVIGVVGGVGVAISGGDSVGPVVATAVQAPTAAVAQPMPQPALDAARPPVDVEAPAAEVMPDLPPPVPEPKPTAQPSVPPPVRAARNEPVVDRADKADKAANRTPGSVYVDVIGGWATVSIGKKSYGETPVKLTLVPGRYTITLVSGDGTKTKNVTVTVPPGGKLQVREPL